MKFHGISMVGKFTNQILDTLPTFTIDDKGREIYLTDGSRWYGSETKWVKYGSGGSSFDLNQTGHGFGVLDTVYNNGSQWVKAIANDMNTVATHVVVDVFDADNITLAQSGKWVIPSHGYTTGYYYTSDTIAGQITDTAPLNYHNKIVYVIDADEVLILPFVTLDMTGSGGSGGDSLTIDVNQVSHGMSVLTSVYHDGSLWIKAIANSEETLGTHVITSVIDANNFQISMMGRFEFGSHGLTPNEYYYTDYINPGVLTDIEPPVYSNPMVFVEDGTFIHILPYRPSITTGTEGSDSLTVIVTQSLHGMSVLNPVYHDGTEWIKAVASSAETLGTHVVVEVIDGDNFKISMLGKFEIAAHGLTPNEYYYTDALIAGALTSTEPGTFSNPLVFVESSSTVHILPYRPSITTGIDDTIGWDEVSTATYTASADNYIMVDTSSNEVSIDLPPVPVDDEKVMFCDMMKTFDVNFLTIGRNGNLIQGLAEDMVVGSDWKGLAFTMVYKPTQGWIVVMGGY